MLKKQVKFLILNELTPEFFAELEVDHPLGRDINALPAERIPAQPSLTVWEHAAFQPAPAKENTSINCWDKDGVENYGLVKIDLLGNRSLRNNPPAIRHLHLKRKVAFP